MLVMRRTSFNTSASVVIPTSGTPYEALATPASEHFRSWAGRNGICGMIAWTWIIFNRGMRLHQFQSRQHSLNHRRPRSFRERKLRRELRGLNGGVAASLNPIFIGKIANRAIG